MIDLRGIDLNLLVSLDALLAESNVTRAAERLHLTQPAVSTQLARLRQIFGDPLLIPAETGRGMTRSTRALELMEPLHLALKNLEAVVRHQPSFDPHTDRRSFVIAANDNATAVLGQRLGSFSEQRDDASLKINRLAGLSRTSREPRPTKFFGVVNGVSLEINCVARLSSP